jgi:hypothetical protein
LIGGKEKTLEQRWTLLNAKKSTLLSRCETYARWTIASLFPPDSANIEGSELLGTNDSIGARCVNHLSNKVVTTLFRPQGAFFRLHLPKKVIKEVAMAAGMDDKAEVAAAVEKIEQELADTEAEATDRQDMVEYRPNATMASQLLICTGNALMYHPPKGPVQVYTVRDYCVVRDLSGTVIEILLREQKAFETFSKNVQDQLRALKKGTTDYDDASNVTIYTHVEYKEDGKFHVHQEADGVKLEIGTVFYPRKTLPWVVLTWKLARGEDYGRGLVEEYSGTFHSLEVYHQSLINIAGIMGDIKFLVNPASLVDVERLNNSPSGSYHSGRADDVTAIETKKQSDAQFILGMIERQEKNLAQAFLLNSSMTRNAERVTAEEIRMVANELETSNGGVYSRLALQWQVPTAHILLAQIEFDGSAYGIEPKIITGMDSLSRQGEMDNLRQFITDLTLLDAVPEDIRAGIDPLKFMAHVGTARQVDYSKFLYTRAEMQQRQQAEAQAVAQQEAIKANGTVAAAAGVEAVKGAQ